MAPQSTYRLQFHAGFTLRDATAIVPYLRELGITHIYASPYLQATKGSTHGYDVIDHCRLNPELGTMEDFEAFVAALRRHDMGHIADVVPNHVGVGTNDNVWWNDVLENGPASRYAEYFDIDWHGSPRPELMNKVLLPVLGEPYGDALESGKLRLAFENGAFAVHYYDRRFPIARRTYQKILGSRAASLDDQPEAERIIAEFHGRPGDPRSFDRLDELLNEQSYRLAYWRVAPDEINYRRFFDINDLAALRMERQDVFEATHTFILRLAAEGKIDGLRIDHPDGLYDPQAYFDRIQAHFARRIKISSSVPLIKGDTAAYCGRSAEDRERWPLYVVAEKILARGERLAEAWAIQGTTGYDFLAMVNGLFIDSSNEQAFTRLYRDLVPGAPDFAQLVYEKKRLILEKSLASELHMLAHRLDRLAQANRHSRDFTLNGLREALREVIACFPVYRSYISDRGVHEADRQYIDAAVECAIERNPDIGRLVFEFIRDTLLLRSAGDEQLRPQQVQFAARFQQLTAPATAKGVEDTAFYSYNRLVSLNEVGGDPDQFGTLPASLHAYLEDRRANWPHALSPLSTHDTKRSEDVRARINVLSEFPETWSAAVSRWMQANARHRTARAPAANDEYLLYQTLIGAWPLAMANEADRASFVARVQAYMEKAMREAKVHTTWTSPNVEYESAVREFVERILDPARSGEFLADFANLQRQISHWGLFNSLAQTLVRLAAPGVPDTYQGTELWDFSLVDPDNRRPVDYAHRAGMLRALKSDLQAAVADRTRLARALLRTMEDGRVKMWIIAEALQRRRDCPALFSTGEYLPLDAAGDRAQHVFGFLRRHRSSRAVTLVPRGIATLLPDGQSHPLGPDVWRDTTVSLPGVEPEAELINVFTGQGVPLSAREGVACLLVAEAFSQFPVALLVSR